MMKIKLKNLQGFSLIELIIVIVLVGILSAVSATIMTSLFKEYSTGKDLTDLMTPSILQTQTLMRELKSAFKFHSIDTNHVSFTDQYLNAIDLQLINGNLIQTVNANPQILMKNLSSLSFNYFDQHLAITHDPDSVYYISLNWTVAQNGLSYSSYFATMIQSFLPSN